MSKPKVKKYTTLKALYAAVCREAGVFKARKSTVKAKWMSRWTLAWKVTGTKEAAILRNAISQANEIMLTGAVGAFICKRNGESLEMIRGEAGKVVFYRSTKEASAVLGPIQDEMNARARGNKGQYLAVFKHPELDEDGRWFFLMK